MIVPSVIPDKKMIAHSCGCVNERHESGVLRSVSKCPRHRRMARDPATLDESYYRKLGVLDADTAHVAEIVEALGPFPASYGTGRALEIGCGCSPYAGAIEAAGWCYCGVDASSWAAEWTSKRWGVETIVSDWESFVPAIGFDLILAAHVLEHLQDAPLGLSRMAECVEYGGQLWIVIPDDSDPVNPDHLWFWSPETLREAVERCGLEVLALEVRKIVKHERFIFCRAVKP